MNENEEIKKPTYFYFNLSYCCMLDLMTNEQAGQLLKAICDYARGSEDSKSPSDPALQMAYQIITQDIDKAYKKYRAQCLNGRKGGAPKGNKNAAKKKAEPVKRLWDFPVNKINNDICYRLDCIFYESEQSDFDIQKYYKKEYIAEIAACYSFCEADSFWDIFSYTGYQNLKEYTLNESVAKVRKELKQAAEKYYEEDTESFAAAFARYKDHAMKILDFPLEEIKKFSDKCDAIFNPDEYSEERLAEIFTNKEIKEIQAIIIKNKANNKQETIDI